MGATVQTVTDLYPERWLKARHLEGRAVVVKIAGVSVEKLRMPDGSKKIAAILAFERASKRLILNKTMCRALIAITHTERLGEWAGHNITLSAAVAPNGRDTITITEATNGNHSEAGA
jgi:hypothetical protein